MEGGRARTPMPPPAAPPPHCPVDHRESRPFLFYEPCSAVRMARQTTFKNHHSQDFPGGPGVKTPRLQCRGRGFDPSSGN